MEQEQLKKALRNKLTPDKHLVWDIIQFCDEQDDKPGEIITALAAALTFLAGVWVKDKKHLDEVASYVAEMIKIGGSEAKDISDRVDTAGKKYVQKVMQELGIPVGEA